MHLLTRRSRLLLIATLCLLPLGAIACAAFVPGYAEERAELQAQLDEAKGTTEAALAELSQARDAGDAAALQAALQQVTAAIQLQTEAVTALAKFEVDSAGKAAGAASMSMTQALTLGGTGFVGLLAAMAKAQANKIATGPSRAQPELDGMWDEQKRLTAELAELRGRLGPPVPMVAASAPAAVAHA